jgi:FkbM family methyltransferase
VLFSEKNFGDILMIKYYFNKLKEEGLVNILKRRIKWYLSLIMINNRFIGKTVEFFGNRVRIDGLVFSVDSSSIKTSHKSVLFFGLHELDERFLLRRHLPRHLPIVECGGGLGVISCLANRTINNPYMHVVIEANPQMIPLLQKNCNINSCKFKIYNKAIFYENQSIEFSLDPGFVGSGIHHDSGEKITVGTTSIKEMANTSGFEKFSLICDIEGSETNLVNNEFDILKDRVDFILIEFHPAIIGVRAVDDIHSRLEHAGFILVEMKGDNAVFKKTT